MSAYCAFKAELKVLGAVVYFLRDHKNELSYKFADGCFSTRHSALCI